MISPKETEVIALHIVETAIDSIVNHALLRHPQGTGQPTFNGMVARELFAVRLLDFIEKVSTKMTGGSGTCVDLLESVVQTGYFDQGNSISGLRLAVAELSHWLKQRIGVKLWLPSLDLGGEIAFPRSDFLYVAGNASKHNLSRLTGVAKRLGDVLAANGHQVDEEDTWLAVEDFEQHFHEDLLAFYCTRITGLLNDVRWGIHEYLIPEFNRSYTPGSDPKRPHMYSYQYPSGVDSKFARWCYWEVMNTVRRKPVFARFIVPDAWKEHPLSVRVLT